MKFKRMGIKLIQANKDFVAGRAGVFHIQTHFYTHAKVKAFIIDLQA